MHVKSFECHSDVEKLWTLPPVLRAQRQPVNILSTYHSTYTCVHWNFQASLQPAELIPQTAVCIRAFNGTAEPTRRILHHLPKPFTTGMCTQSAISTTARFERMQPHVEREGIDGRSCSKTGLHLSIPCISVDLAVDRMISRQRNCSIVNIINYTLNSSGLGHRNRDSRAMTTLAHDLGSNSLLNAQRQGDRYGL